MGKKEERRTVKERRSGIDRRKSDNSICKKPERRNDQEKRTGQRIQKKLN